MSTSRILAYAQVKNMTGPTQLEGQGDPQGNPKDMAVLTAQGSQKMGTDNPNEMRSYPDYSKGPSALDKASQLFFFTEILRGESLTTRPTFAMTSC